LFFALSTKPIARLLPDCVHHRGPVAVLVQTLPGHLPPRQFPHIRSLAGLATYNGAAELDQGLDTLLTGLYTKLRAADS